MGEVLTVSDMIAKRRARWQERHDLDFDTRLVDAAVKRLLSDRSLMQEIRERPYLLIELCFHIVDKERDTVPFFFNEVQRDFIEQYEKLGTAKPYFILKGRQQGFTSLITAMQLAFAITSPNFAGMTLADKADNTAAIFNDKARMVYERLPDKLKPSERFSNKKELFFDKLNSSWRVSTATEQVGRSRTLIFVHFSEVAFYQCSLASLQKGIGEAITKDAFLVYETTANGFNEAKDLWDSGSCFNLFYEWWRTAEYRSNDFSYIENASDPWLLARIKTLEEKGLDREQIAWYCRKYDGYLDKDTIKQEYPCTPQEAFVSSGNCVFDKEGLQDRLLSLPTSQGRRGFFEYKKTGIPVLGENGETLDMQWEITDISFVEDRAGYILLHEEPRVKKDNRERIVGRCPYVLGADTAALGEDWFAAKVVDNLTGNTVATLHKQRMDEDLFAEQLYCLGRRYHDATIGVETNYSRVPMNTLDKLGYPNLYLRERYDTVNKEVEQVLGFETTSKTRPIIIGELVRLMREDPRREVHAETIKEMLAFVKKENGRQEAQSGAHDDLVLALAIAHAVSGQGEHRWLSPTVGARDFVAENFHLEENGEDTYMDWEDF